ncbi:protein-disulfide isomerase [Mesorhizobium soli]|uniref:DsbA family protein n=1 Tax=Pseudaminobacter soli (ex Li et al. 2025) TaxID=1295366 RepID=UPI0024757815|nr:DsbA family protein [Mesorhizobium soli]MDH6232931.1 protein-disulfide isomerase [Mesorhizobium soli]
MNKAILLGTTAIAVSFAMLAFGFMSGRHETAVVGSSAQAASVQTADAQLDRKAVESIVRDYLLDNPEILVDVQNSLEQKREAAQRVAHRETIEEDKAQIFNSAYDGVVGNPNGKVTIVEFYDYNCGYCKRAQHDMQALTASDPDLRFVLKEFPILGPDSQKAHVVSMAFRALEPEKYGEFHNQLLGGQGRASEDSAIKIALSLGVDEAKLRQEMKNPAIVEAFSKTYDLANKLAISGTPSYVVGNEVVFGALGKDALAEKISAAKKCLDTGC